MRGRDREWRAVLGLLDSAADGAGATLLVDGEPGAGKSLLLGQAVSAASARGFALITGAARRLGRVIAAGPTPPRQTVADLERLRLRGPRACATRPLLVALDDVHWTDPDSLAVVPGLHAQLSGHPVGWLLTRTPHEGGAGAAELFRALAAGGASRVRLGPLPVGAVSQMVADAFGVPPGPGLLALASTAGGNPSLLGELLAGLREERRVAIRGGRARLLATDLPDLPDRALAAACRLVDRLGSAARRLVRAAAVLGPSFAMDDLAEFLGAAPAALLPPLEEALSAGVLAGTGEALAFRQEIVWRAVAAEYPLTVQQALHRQAGEMLLRRGAAVQAAAHLAKGIRHGNAAALALLDQAVTEIAPRAPEAAAELAARALEHTDLADPARLPRAVAAAQAQIGAARLDRATALLQVGCPIPAQRAAPPAGAVAELRCARSDLLYLQGQATAAVEEARAVLAEPDVDTDLRDRVWLALLHAAAATGDWALLRTHATAVLGRTPEGGPGAGRTGGDPLAVGALTGLALAEWQAGRLRDGLDLARAAVRWAQAPDHTRPRLVLAALLADLGELAEARALVDAEAAAVAMPGQAVWAPGPEAVRARIELAAGRLAEATSAAEAALRRAEAGGTALFRPLAAAVLGEAALRRGDLRGAEQHVHSGWLGSSGFGGTWGAGRCTLVAARVAEARAGPGQAIDLARELYRAPARHGPVLLGEPGATAWLVRVALAATEREAARAVVAAVESLAADNPDVTALRPLAAHVRGILDGDADLLALAAARSADPWAQASAAEDLGVLLSRGREAAAEQIGRLDQALAGYQRGHAARDAARVRGRLRQLGVRHRHWAQADRPVRGWGSLTDAERAVSLLVAEGCTNRQVADRIFVSPHTVAFHLRHVYRKLRIRSRVELARLVIEQGHRGQRRDRGAGPAGRDTGL